MSTEKSYNFYQDYRGVPSSNLTLSKNVEYYLYLKRSYDIILATVGLIIAVPIVLLFTILIVMETPGSPFYVQERSGKNGKRFKMVKLRSMTIDAEKEGAKWAEVNDPRITHVGAFIRKTRIDELPQLVNILKGDMSIVGPRPERPFFTAKFNKEIKGFENRLLRKCSY